MFKALKNLAVLGAMVSINLNVSADDIRLGDVGYGGTGCPGNSASVTLSPDRKSLSIIFDQFVALAGGTTRKLMDRKNCNIAAGVHVPQGLSVSVMAIDYRGYNSLPRDAYSTFSAEYFFAGTIGPKFQKTFVGPLDREYLFSNKIGLESLVWSPCGADVNLRVNSAMLVKTNQQYQEAMAAVDSADVKASLVYHLQWQQCR